MGCFVYTLLGSCKDITIGPTAIMAIMTHEYSGEGGPDFAVLLCFLSGIIILASGICNLGKALRGVLTVCVRVHVNLSMRLCVSVSVRIPNIYIILCSCGIHNYLFLLSDFLSILFTLTLFPESRESHSQTRLPL